MNKFLFLTFIVTFCFSPFAWTDCQKIAEGFAIGNEQKDSPKEKFLARNTTKTTSVVKADEEAYSTEIYDSKGAFVPYDVTVKKVGCKAISVKAVTL